jgi:3-phenylpropionate/cinnamic acid dioxygenase small subunit
MPKLSRSDAEDLLYCEARLLDERRYGDWFRSFADELTYWIPCNSEDLDPRRSISIVYDDAGRLRDRVARLESGMAHAQNPPSKTSRLISNVQVSQTADDLADVSSAFILYELRRGHSRVFGGRYQHRFRFEDGHWKIALKKCALVNNDEVIDNLTFIV